MTYEEQKNLYSFHKENSDRIEKEREFQQHSFDNWLLKLCGGSFAVSFAFVEKLIDFSVAICKPVLIIGWSSFALCLILFIFGFMNSERLCHFAHEQEWDIYQNEVEDAKIPLKKSFRSTLANHLNKINIILFFCGNCMFYHIFSDKPLEDKSGTVPDKPNFSAASSATKTAS